MRALCTHMHALARRIWGPTWGVQSWRSRSPHAECPPTTISTIASHMGAQHACRTFARSTDWALLCPASYVLMDLDVCAACTRARDSRSIRAQASPYCASTIEYMYETVARISCIYCPLCVLGVGDHCGRTGGAFANLMVGLLT